MRLARYGLVATLCLALLAPSIASADQHEEHGHEHHDVRHGHDHYYPERGFTIAAVPRGAHAVVWGGEHYWFHEGVWYRPHAHGFVVIAPPFGVVVPVLPAFATLVVIGGLQYYYANEAYYRYLPQQGGYAVVAPPEAAADPPPAARDYHAAAPPASDNVFIYPRGGQSAEQQARDRYECHRWAADQTGFDPTRPAGGVAPEVEAAKRADYLRAQQACLEAHNYTVR